MFWCSVCNANLKLRAKITSTKLGVTGWHVGNTSSHQSLPGESLGEATLITTTGPAIVGSAYFWYSITGLPKSLMMINNCAFENF